MVAADVPYFMAAKSTNKGTHMRSTLRTVMSMLTLAVAMLFTGTTQAGTGFNSKFDFYGNWQMAISGVTGCGATSMLVTVTMNTAGIGTNATIKQHGQCGDSVLTSQTFTIHTVNGFGTATGGLSCGPGCGWNLNIQMAPDRGSFNLVDVDPVNPGNFISGVAVRVN